MEKTKKIKVTQVATDFRITAERVVEILNEAGKNVKKTGSVTNNDINIIMEKLTSENQADSFDAYFNDKTSSADAAKERQKKSGQSKSEIEREEREAEKKKLEEEKALKLEEAAKAKENAKKEAKSDQPKKKDEKSEKNDKKNQSRDSKQPRHDDHRNSDKRSDKNNRQSKDTNQNRDDRQSRDDRQNRRKSDFDNSRRDGRNNRNNRQDNRDQRSKDGGNNLRDDRKQNHTVNQPSASSASSEKTSTPKTPIIRKEPKNTAIKANKHEEKKRKPAEKHAASERVILNTEIATETSENYEKKRTVDTRGSYINLDKYNDRYDDMADSSRSRDNFDVKKQKINQKSKQYNKKGIKKHAKNDAEEKMKRLELERARKQQLKVKIPDIISVGELAERLKVTASKVITELMKLGIMATVNEDIDFDTAALVADELGAKVEKEVVVTIEDRIIDDTEDKEEDLKPRCPVVCIMGHVDHGKTSILDRIRHSHVQAGEAGGITQAIGAYQVSVDGREITFLDTPGHEAFTAMRARGADITDIAVLVVAADDGVMPQTVESINHAKAANIPMIVAINKIDAPGANVEKIKEDLTKYGIVCEDWGGDTICVPVSAKTGEGIDDLLENILLVADVAELKANPNRAAKGAVIEARLDKGRGPVATLLVQKGTLHKGDSIIAGTSVGRIRMMTNYLGKAVKEAGPSVPVEITGLDSVPEAGDSFDAVADERLAKDLAEQRKAQAKDAKFADTNKVTLDNLFEQIEEGEMQELDIIVKADVQGSAEAVKQSLEKLSNDKIRVRVIHSAVGAVNESDVMLATASNAIIVGFNVRPDNVAAENAKRDGVEIKLYRVIYDAIEEIEAAMKGMLAPKTQVVELGSAEVRNIFHISKVGTVAGSFVLKGKIVRGANVRIVRDGIIIADDEISGLKRFKDDAKEVAEGYECGISLSKFNDVKQGDIIEAYTNEEVNE